MKNLLPILLALATSLCAGAETSSRAEQLGLSEPAYKALVNAVDMADLGMYDTAIEDFDRLLTDYPDNYLIQYERLYALYAKGDYNNAAKAAKKLVSHKDAEPMIYQLYGNALDLSGNAGKARKIYNEGIKRFPAAGNLYLELGNLDYAAGKYDDALDSFNNGIEADPAFPSNYFRAAGLYLASSAKPWGLIYAETAILLAVSNQERHTEMAQAIVACMNENVQATENGGELQVKITLSQAPSIISADSGLAYPSFPALYESCVTRSLLQWCAAKRPFHCTISGLAELRRGVVEAYYGACHDYFGNAMYLLEYHKKIMDAGHWDAYNHWLFGHAFPDEMDKWYDENEEKFKAFAQWFNSDPFTLDATHTVGANTILRDANPIDMTKAISILSGMPTD